MKKKSVFLFIALCALIGGGIHAQDFGFGFGFDDEEAGNSGGAANSLNVSIGGEIAAFMTGYFDDFSNGTDHTRLGEFFAGSLNFSAGTSLAEGVINLNLNPSSSPVSIDEAYMRVFFSGFDITAGLRKLTWGKADSFGPLDVINPLDYSGIFTEMADNTSLMGVKIARPLVHASFRLGDFSKLEGVFVPWFQPHYIPAEGRWAPAQMQMLANPPMPLPPGITIKVADPAEMDTFAYAQAGLRFTTTIGSSDIGAQYYYGRLPQPAVDGIDMVSNPVTIGLIYNPYHQIGLDYAQVLFGFNTRVELAANITKDLTGDDGSVYNPSIAWSFGFDRDLFAGINLNLQVNESIRLMHDKLGSGDIINLPAGSYDIEGGLSLTATRLTAALSRKFLRDELELRAAVVWGIEDKDFAVMPALIWTRDDIRFALSGGFFGGDSDGQLGQYRDNNFLKVSFAYTF